MRHEAMLRGVYWNYFRAQFGSVHAFGYNSADSNRFGWNLELSEYTVGGWAWQILGAIRAVVTVWEAGEILLSTT